MPSDFQDYSLVTLVGVAAHLMHVSDGVTGNCASAGCLVCTTEYDCSVQVVQHYPTFAYLLAAI